MRKILFALLLFVAGIPQVMADKTSDYKEYAARVRAEVWADSLPQFINPPEVPDRFRNESAIILAAHKDIFAKKKTGVGFDRNASLIPIKRVALINMDDYLRTLILINDKTALEEFSEYDMPVKSGYSDWFFQEKDERKYVLGVRIIKPDGRIVEIPTDDFVILSQQKNDDKADRQKLAVPGLEVGDKLDIFLFTHTALKNIQPETIDIALRQDYPVLSYTIGCKIDDDLSTIYRQLHGAPELTVTQGPDKDYILTAAIPAPLDAEPQMLYSSAMQSPRIEMLIYNRRFDEYTPQFARKDGIQANPDAIETVVKDRINALDNSANMAYAVKQQLGSVKGNPMKTVKEKFKKGEWSKARTADYIYNLLVFSYMTGKYKYYPGDFVNEFAAALEQTDIKDFRKGVIAPRKDGPLDSITDYKDLYFFVYLPDTKQYYSSAFRGYNTSSEVMTAHQGQCGLLTYNGKLSKKERLAENRRLEIPLATAHDNRFVTTVNAVIDGTALDITRRIDAYGASKNNVGPLLTSDNLLNGYLAYLNRDGVVADPQMLRKEKSKDREQRMERNSDEAKEQLEQIREAVKDYHGSEPREFKGYEILASGIGVTPDSAAISYEAEYVMDGLVKKAGRNLMVSIGNLIGEQPEVLPSQRIRLPGDDVVMTYPQEKIAKVYVKIPAGYAPSASSLAKLNTEISNKAGSFSSKAVVNGDCVELAVTREFSEIRLPASEWNSVLELVDAAARFNTLTLLLEKKK